jgi:MFS family permease
MKICHPVSSRGVVIISFVTIAIAYGLNFSFSVFFVAILEEFRWSRANIAGAFSLASFIIGVGSWPAGRLVDRFGPRKIMMGGTVVLSLATMAGGLIREVWHLYFFCGILAGAGICGLGGVPNSVLISNWFERKRGSMVGIAFSGMGIGILAVSPSAQYLIFSLGWRMAYLVLGLAVLLLLVPLALFLEDHPHRSLKRMDAGQFGEVGRAKDSEKERDWTLRRVMKILPFWALFISNFILPLGVFPVAVHQVAYIIDLGYSKLLAAFIFGAMGLLSAAGRPLFGVLSDRIGREQAVTLSFLCSIGGVLVLILLPVLKSPSWLYLYAILFGLGFGSRGPVMAAMIGDKFPGKHFGSIYGFVNVGNGVGGALGPWLGGLLYDLTGSYRIPFSLCIPALVLANIFFWIGGRHRSRLYDRTP